MPTGRRRQRSSSSSSAPADASPSISIAVARFLSSLGIGRRASACPEPAAIVTCVRPRSRPSSPTARTKASAGRPGSARVTIAVRSLSSGSPGARRRGNDAGASAKTVSGPRCARLAAKSDAAPSSIPSLSQTMSGASPRSNFLSRARAAPRSFGHGSGASASAAARASAGRSSDRSLGAALPAGGAVSSRTMRRDSRSA